MEKNKNSTLPQEGDEVAFEDNADQYSKDDSENEQENKNEEKNSIYMENQEMFQKN